jgi:hypothetical protein
MSDKELQQLLFEQLKSHPALALKEFEVLLDEQGRVVIHRGGHVRGIWLAVMAVLQWTPAGYNGPLFQVADVEAAVWHTLVALGLEKPRI